MLRVVQTHALWICGCVSASNQSCPTNVHDFQKSQPSNREVYYWRLQLEVCSLLSVFPSTFSRVKWSPYKVKDWWFSPLCLSPELRWTPGPRGGGGGCRWPGSGQSRPGSTPGSGVASGLPRLPESHAALCRSFYWKPV